MNVVTYRSANYIADALLFAVASIVGIVLWSGLAPEWGQRLLLDSDGRTALLALHLVFYGTNFFCLAYFGVYHTSRLRSMTDAAVLYLRSLGMAFLLSAMILYIYPLEFKGRSYLVSASCAAYALLLLKESGNRKLLRFMRKQGRLLVRAVIIGNNRNVIDTVMRRIEHEYLLGITVVGVVTPEDDFEDPEEPPTEIGGVPVIGDTSKLTELLDRIHAGTVIIIADDLPDQSLDESIWTCEERGLEIWLKLGLLDRVSYRASIDSVDGLSFISFRGGPQDAAALFAKSVADRVLAFFLLILCIPLFVLVAALIKRCSPGPVFFVQNRAGLFGRRFRLFKFRTMVTQAEQMKAELQKRNEMKGPVFKLSDDPRITGIGWWLRRTSIDELPQLWNVVLGDMSLVGPRPLPLDEVKRFQGWQRRRLSMKPGITGLWQVSGRSTISDFDDWARMDLEYIDNWDLVLDIVILLRTIPAVIRGRGAY